MDVNVYQRTQIAKNQCKTAKVVSDTTEQYQFN